MAIVVRGLGLPEDGALVAGGLGVSESNPGAITATLSGSSSLTATLTASDATPSVVALPGGLGGRRRRAVYRTASASLRVGVWSAAVGAVSTPATATSAAEPVAVQLFMEPLPADVVAHGSGVLRVAALSAAAGIRSTSSSGVALTSVGVRSSCVGEVAWSILDDEDVLFLLVV